MFFFHTHTDISHAKHQMKTSDTLLFGQKQSEITCFSKLHGICDLYQKPQSLQRQPRNKPNYSSFKKVVSSSRQSE